MIGFIGMGIMGSRMAANLHKKGHGLIVYNRTKSKTRVLSEEGIMVVDSPSELAGRVDVIITMVSHPQAVRKIALGENGFLNQLKPESIWIDCSTVNPSFSRQMKAKSLKHSVRFMDAPVAGSKGPAATGDLVFFVGGEETDLQQCNPYFSAMGRKVVHVGPAGSGAAMKMVFNLLLGNAMASFAEGMSLGRSMGLSRDQLFEVLIGSPVLAPFIALKKDKINTGNFEADFPLRWMQKDLHLATLCGYEYEAVLPLTNTAKELYAHAKNRGLAELDFAAIYRFMNK